MIIWFFCVSQHICPALLLFPTQRYTSLKGFTAQQLVNNLRERDSWDPGCSLADFTLGCHWLPISPLCPHPCVCVPPVWRDSLDIKQIFEEISPFRDESYLRRWLRWMWPVIPQLCCLGFYRDYHLAVKDILLLRKHDGIRSERSKNVGWSSPDLLQPLTSYSWIAYIRSH